MKNFSTCFFFIYLFVDNLFVNGFISVTQRNHGLAKFLREKGMLINDWNLKMTHQGEASEVDSDIKATADIFPPKKKIVVIGAGWGGLSAANTLATQSKVHVEITLIDASPSVGGLVRDGYSSLNGTQLAEAGQHGFWDNYHNIFDLLTNSKVKDYLPYKGKILTDYAEQGQYSPNGLEAIWPVYRDQPLTLPTGLAQALYTRFNNLPVIDRLSAFPLVLAFSEFTDTEESWKIYDKISFRDLCTKLGVSRRCYDEAFEPMILTGLFAPGHECSAAAALGMAYFFVLKSQNSFDVRWCKGNIGELIFQPWIEFMQSEDVPNPIQLLLSTRVTGFEVQESSSKINKIQCMTEKGETISLETDEIVFATGATALNAFVRNSPALALFPDFRKFANLRGTSVLATRIYLDRFLDIPYSANACWGFDAGIGMTFFDISTLHYPKEDQNPVIGSVIEVDYYHSSSLLVMNDEDIISKVKKDLNTILGKECIEAQVLDAAVIRLPQAVNWYYPGSYQNMPNVKSESISNAYFAGDIVRTRHGSWSQEKAYVTGIEAANMLLGRDINYGVKPLSSDEAHVSFGRNAVQAIKKTVGASISETSNPKSLFDFIW